MSRRGSLAQRCANVCTDSYESMSSCHTSILHFGFAVLIGFAAASPLSIERTPRIRWVTPSVGRMCAVARPNPLLPPVRTTVWSVRLGSGPPGRSLCRAVDMTFSIERLGLSVMDAMLV
jgi:hypothetical protein